MKFNWEVSVGDIIAFCALVGSVITYFSTRISQRKSKGFAQKADAFNDSAKKYYDLMVEKLKNVKNAPVTDGTKMITKAYCDANIVKIGRNSWILKVYNKGSLSASDVLFKFLIDDAPTAIGIEDPMKLLEPQKNVDYHLLITLDLSGTSWEYEITWTNEDGTTDSKIGVLTLPLS